MHRTPADTYVVVDGIEYSALLIDVDFGCPF